MKEDCTEARYYAKALLMNLYFKSKRWQHEAEYRIVQPLIDTDGEGMPLSNDCCQLRIRHIYAGFRCSSKNRRRLYDAAVANGLDSIYVVGKGTDNNYDVYRCN